LLLLTRPCSKVLLEIFLACCLYAHVAQCVFIHFAWEQIAVEPLASAKAVRAWAEDQFLAVLDAPAVVVVEAGF